MKQLVSNIQPTAFHNLNAYITHEKKIHRSNLNNTQIIAYRLFIIILSILNATEEMLVESNKNMQLLAWEVARLEYVLQALLNYCIVL